jgi:hypothetical protein
VLSDGITSTNDVDRLSRIGKWAASKGVPIMTVGIGSDEPVRDLQLYDVLVDEVAFVDDLLAFSAKVKAHGYRGEISLTLRDKQTGDVLGSASATSSGDGTPIPITLPIVPKNEGEFDFVIEATPLQNESNTDNNRETRHVSVRGEQMQVLLADGQPRYEFRNLKQLLEREKTIKLQTVLQDSDVAYSAEDRTALDHFPVKREDLLAFDVILIGDVDLGRLSPSVQKNLQSFVRDAGGGLVLIAGSRFNPLSYGGTVLETLLPVELTAASLPSAEMLIDDEFRPELTVDGRQGTTIFRFAPDESENRQIWEQLAPLRWLVRTPVIKKGTRVFAVHPTLSNPAGQLPVISLQHYGAGKVLFHATDETWRWRHLDGDRYFGR